MNLRATRGALTSALTAAFICFLTLAGETATQKSGGPPPTAAPAAAAAARAAPTAIPIVEVATQATEVTTLLRALSLRFGPSPEIEAIHKHLAALAELLEPEIAETAVVLEEQPSLATLQGQQLEWQRNQVQTTAWLNLLTERAIQLQKALDHLTDLQETWTKTRDAAQAAQAPEPIVQQIGATLAAIEALQPTLQAHHAAVLDLQSRVAEAVAQCEAALTQIAQAQQRAMGGILSRDSLPIWSAELWKRARTTLPGRLRGIAAAFMVDLRHYLTTPSRGMPLQIVLFAALALLFCVARRHVRRWTEAGEEVSLYTTVFERPYAAALFISLLIGSSPHWQVPAMVRQLLNVLWLTPMIRLAQQGADAMLIPGLFAVGALFILDAIRQALAGAPLLEQVLLLLEGLAGIILLGWSLAFGNLRGLPAQARDTARLGAGLVLLTLSGGLATGVLGYLPLARLLVSALLGGAFLALGVYSFLRVMSGLVALAFRVWPLRLLRMVQHHRELLEHRVHRILVWLAIGAWGVRSLDYVGLLQPAQSLFGAIFSAKLERGSLSISLEDVLVFVLTVWVTTRLSALIRFVLEEDVYPRMQVAIGLSYSISSLLHYLILALGLVAGMAALGVDLSKVSVLAGAFGVGIGFGLQSVVNNFVSGIILLFERPIHVGDTVEIGNLLGDVREIGIRACKVRTRQGADIVVPNAQLVTERLTNWTLGDRLRRIDLTVGVNYGAEPQKAIAVLEEAGRAHPKVLRHPPPRALLTGYGDSSINFELRVWTDHFEDSPQIRSDLAVALYNAVQAAGMQFPFPQREVRLLHDPEAGLAEPSTTERASSPLPDERTTGQSDKLAEG
jgi:potassium efflux system protein